MTFNITDVSNSCCRSRIPSGENDMRPALADRRSLIPFAAAGVRRATMSVCFPTTVTGGLVLLAIEFRSCPADPFAAGRGSWSCGFIDCFLTWSAVLANAFDGECLVLFFALVRPVPDFVRVREFFCCLEVITSCFGWLVRDARVTSTHAIKGQLVQGVQVPSDASVTLGPALKSDQNFTAHVGGASATKRINHEE
jgi:hypothetical protein